MVQSLNLRYRTAAESDQDRANAIFSGAVLVYRSLPAMHALVGCLREITLLEIGLNDPCSAESMLGSREFRRRASCVRLTVRENIDVGRLYKKVFTEVGVDVSAIFYDHFKLRFQPSNEATRSRYMLDLPAHRDTWGSNIHSQINWWAPVWPVTVDRTIGIFPAQWHVPVSNFSADWSYRELMQHLRRDESTEYPMLPQCRVPPSPAEAVPVIDRMADRGIIHKNKASRHKSRLNTAIKKLAG